MPVADRHALQAIGLGYGAIMTAVVMTAVLVVANAQRTMTSDAQGAAAQSSTVVAAKAQ
jgi:hypothetical protein